MRRHMPTRYKKVSNRELRRRATQVVLEHEALQAQGAKTFAILLTVLAQKGGEVTVTKGTIDQVGANLARLSYQIVTSEVPGEHIIRLVEGKDDGVPQTGETDPAPAQEETVSGTTGPEASPDTAASAPAGSGE